MKIYELLNINAEIISDFQLLSLSIDTKNIEKTLERNLLKLKLIENESYTDSGVKVSKYLIDEVINKVRRLALSNDKSLNNWTIRELRVVSYYMAKLCNNHQDYYFALMLLDLGWRNLFFNGLVYYILHAWCYIHPDLRDATCKLLSKKLREYGDRNRRYNLLKNHVNFLESGGPRRMANLLQIKNIDIRNAPQLLGFKNAALKQSYYSDVIINFVESSKIIEYDVIEELLNIHNLGRTKKIVCAVLVERANKNNDAVKRSLLCRLINRLLGDVTLSTTWAPFYGATEAEIDRLRGAMKLVNLWYAQQIIEVFFDVCVQDIQRKKFWLKYVNNISGFKLVGSILTKRKLQSDNRISGMFQKHFIETSSIKSQTSALVLFIKNKVLVEFSDTGALYAYNQDNRFIRHVTVRKYLNSTEDLKIPTMPTLVETDYYYGTCYSEEGRMRHAGAWQTRLTNWLNVRVLNKGNTSISFLQTRDDNIFRQIPISEDFDVYNSVD